MANLEQAESIERAQDRSVRFTNLRTVADAYETAGDYGRAERSYQEAVNTDAPFEIQVCANESLGSFYCKQKRYADAEAQFKRCIAICEKEEQRASSREPKERLWNMITHSKAPTEREREDARRKGTVALSYLADCYEQWGKPAEADRVFAKQLRYPGMAFGLFPRARQEKDHKLAARLFERDAVTRGQVLGADDPSVACSTMYAAKAWSDSKQPDRADAAYRKAIAIWQRNQIWRRNPKTWNLFTSGGCTYREGYGDSLTWYAEFLNNHGRKLEAARYENLDRELEQKFASAATNGG